MINRDVHRSSFAGLALIAHSKGGFLTQRNSPPTWAAHKGGDSGKEKGHYVMILAGRRPRVYLRMYGFSKPREADLAWMAVSA